MRRALYIAAAVFLAMTLIGIELEKARVRRQEEARLEMEKAKLAGERAQVALSSTELIYAAIQEYSAKYRNGFPSQLKVMGRPEWGKPTNCNAAGLIQLDLANGAQEGYMFQYVPGAPVGKPASGCASSGVRSFALLIRPATYVGRVSYSFFVDETGIIRVTPENRAPNASDPTVAEQIRKELDRRP